MTEAEIIQAFREQLLLFFKGACVNKSTWRTAFLEKH